MTRNALYCGTKVSASQAGGSQRHFIVWQGLGLARERGYEFMITCQSLTTPRTSCYTYITRSSSNGDTLPENPRVAGIGQARRDVLSSFRHLNHKRISSAVQTLSPASMN